LILLSESLHALEIAGGVLIFAGIAFERIVRRPSAEVTRGRDEAEELRFREAVGRE
jgi:small neutral amino acid transporter SnatA (MarC family)